MANMYKINRNTKRNFEIGESDIYRKFSEQFDNLFNSEEMAKDEKEFEEIYVMDKDFEDQIEVFRNSYIDMVKFCVGYTGIGKTTSIRHCFNLGVSREVHINSEKRELVFPTFLDGYQIDNIERFDLSKRISAVCTELEVRHPELRELLKTQDGKTEFYEFIRRHTSFALENIDPIDAMDMGEQQLINEKLRSAYKESPFEYQANRLKFYIMKNYDKYNRLVIVLDDIESLPEKYQNDTIAAFLKFHDCMRNTDYPNNHEYYINLLISVRPHTYRIYRNNRKIETFAISEPAILKRDSVDMELLFEKRFDYYTKNNSRVIGNIETWNKCYNELLSMNRQFDGQYKNMIRNLCFMNVRQSLASYARVFANRLWVQKNKIKEESFTINSRDYAFNNINVIRALACNEEQMYWGDCESIIPNIFLSTEDDDYSIYCILVMKYFHKKKREEVYGLNAERLKSVTDEWNDIFDDNIMKKFLKALYFLFEYKILRKSINDFDDIKTLDTEESLNDESKLYISPRGNEIYEMFGRDSVLLEMLRENAWRDYENREYDRTSSYELMRDCKQNIIFRDLLEYIDYLSEEEDNILSSIENRLGKREKYKKLFGRTPASQFLLTGVKKSIDYSNIIARDGLIWERYTQVNDKISSIMNNF